MSDTTKESKPGLFASVFSWIGLIAGGLGGFQIAGVLGALIGAVILMGIGSSIGRVVDTIVARLIFITFAIISVLINTAMRRFFFELVSSAFSAS